MHVRRWLNELKAARKKALLIKEGYVAILLHDELSRDALHQSAIILDRLLNARSSFLQVFEIHNRMQLNVGIEGQEPWFSHGRNLSSVLQVKDDEPSSLAVVISKIGRFRFQVA